MRDSIITIPVVRYHEGKETGVDDGVAVEEPLEIFLDGNPYYVTMRLPGEEVYLASGYCFSEGIINSLQDITTILYCQEATGNRIDVRLDEKRRTAKSIGLPKAKHFTTYSSCGICGKEMIDDIRVQLQQRPQSTFLGTSDIHGLNDAVERKQEIFHSTGGSHAAGIFRSDGTLLSFSEDVGRHNALDKAIGRLVHEENLSHAKIVVLTSRLTYEIVQKTGRLGAEFLIGASAPTSLAIELAKEINLTLIGFSRKDRGNIYTCAGRVLF